MKRKRTENIPASTREVYDDPVCDFCKKVIKPPTSFEVQEVVLECETGRRFPEGGSGKKMSIDCCVDCWDETMLPFFRSLGVDPHEEDWES